MARYIARRLVHAVLLVAVTLVVSFVVLQLAPGDPSTRYIDSGATVADIDRIRSGFGLDDPVPVRFVRWASRFVRGDFGNSLVSHRPVADMLSEVIPRTLLLTGLAFLLQLGLGFAAGVGAAVGRGGRWDHTSSVVAFVLYALPSFYFAYLLITVFSLRLDWLPTGGISTIGSAPLSGWPAVADRLQHLVLPVAVLGLGGAAGWVRFTRGAVLDELSADHILTARAKGLGRERVVMVHALRGALPQLLTLVGVSVPYLLGGAVVVEKVFAWPGMGALVVDAIYARDYPVVLAANFLAATMVIGASLVVDIVYGVLDPRMKLASSDGRSPAR